MTYGFWSLVSGYSARGDDHDDKKGGKGGGHDDARGRGGKDDERGDRDKDDKRGDHGRKDDGDHGRGDGHGGRGGKDDPHGGWTGGKDDCDDCYSVRIEAEDMSRWNYAIEKDRDASGDEVVKLCGDYGKIWTTFDGPSGAYDLKLDYIDETDGKGWIKIYVGDELVKSVRLDDQTGATSITLEGIEIARGETIKIYGYSDCGEFARIDSLQIDACDPNAPPKFTNVGDACVDVEVAETSTAVFDLDASDADGDSLTYAISGGDDAHLFVIDAKTGEISFREGPDFEAPKSKDGDNVYEIEVTVDDGKGGKDVGCLKVEVTDVDDAPKPGDDCTFTFSYGGLDVAVTLTELSDGSVRFDVEVPEGSQKVGDLRGLFFHLSDESKIAGLSVSGDDVTGAQFREDRVSDLGNGANVNGLGRFDAGVEFGTSGLRDDIRATSFTLTADGGLTLDDFRDQDFAVRLTSVGREGGWRSDSVKMEGNAGALDCDCGCETCAEGFTKLTFDDLARGTVVSDQFQADGVIVTAERAGGSGNAAMIFDGANPTGGDADLRTATQGNLLIISEDDDSSDPDDNWQGGKIVFTFPTLAEIDELVVVDVEESGGTIDLFDAFGQKIGTVAFPAGADGSIRTIGIDAEGVARMEVNFKGSGAVDDLCFKPGEPPENLPPEPAPDAGDVCSNEQTEIDVLANDVDPDAGDASGLTITGVVIGGVETAIAEGQSLTLDSGAEVTLTAGRLAYDLTGEDDFDALLIGQKGTDVFEYVVEDEDGASATAEVTVEVCGDLNVVETISNDAPALATIDIDRILDASGRITDSTVAIDFSDPAFTLDGIYGDAYCVDRDRSVQTESSLARVYSTLGDLPDVSLDGGSVIDKEENLDLLNWVLNQGFEDSFSFDDIQSAIWQLVDERGGIDTDGRTPGVQLSSGAQTIVDLAFTNGEGFVPSGENGDILGLILEPVVDDGAGGYDGNGQYYVMGVQLEDCLCV